MSEHATRRGAWLPPAALPVVVAVLVLTARAPAQGLDLPPVLERPPLGETAAAIDLWATLEQELAPLIDRAATARGDEHVVVRAMITYRIIAADLLARGHELGPRGSAAVLAGAHLADGRADVDGALAPLRAARRADGAVPADPAPGPWGDAVRSAIAEVQRRRALAALARFNEGAVELVRMPAPTDAADLDAHLQQLLGPLAEAVVAGSGAPVVSHWPGAGEVARPEPPSSGGSSTPPAPPDTEPAAERLEARLVGSPLPAPTRAIISEMLEYLDRGEAFSDLRPIVSEYRRLLAGALDFGDTVDGATWLTDAHRTAYLERLHGALDLFHDGSTRTRGQEELRRLDVTRQAIVRIDALHRRGVDLRSVRSALLGADALLEDEGEPALDREALGRLMAVLDRMITFREMEPVALRRELRAVQQQLRRAYLEAEEQLVAEVETVTGDPRAVADPAFSSLMADHAQYLQDLQRLRLIPGWIDAVERMNSAAAVPFARQARKMSQWLLDTNRRPDGLRAIDQFEQQIALFEILPFEAELDHDTPELASVTGSRARALHVVISEARAGWAEAWGRGDAAGPEAARMLRLYRLMQSVADVVELRRLGEDASALNRWAGWHLPPGTDGRTVEELQNRLKLATDAAVRDDADGLTRQLDEIDRDLPLVKLVGRLAQVLGPALASRPVGARSVLGQCMIPPPADAWWIRRRDDLADLCRYAMERDFAEGSTTSELAQPLQEFTNALSDDMLRELGERRRPLPVLLGFDGSDPDASDVEAPVRGPRRRR